MIQRVSALLPMMLLLLSGCVSPPTPAPAPLAVATQPASITTMLFFGRSINAGGEVTERQFDDFIQTEVCKRFPDGFTLLEATGLWSEPTVTYREKSKVLMILHAGTAETSKRIDEIREQYKKQFQQTAVLRIDTAHLKTEF